MPVRTVALEPEQEVGRAAAGKASRSEADMHSAAHKPKVPRVLQLGSEVTRYACRTPQATRGTLYTKDVRRACRGSTTFLTVPAADPSPERLPRARAVRARGCRPRCRACSHVPWS